MKTLARSFLAAVLLIAALAHSARATASLSFEGSGYWIDLEIGLTETPTIGSVRFHAPGDTKGVILSRQRVTVEAFDTTRHVLVLRYAGGGGVAPFGLSVQGDSAVLAIGHKRVTSQFRWDM